VQHHSLADNDANNSWTSTTFSLPVPSGSSMGIILLHDYFVPSTLLPKLILELLYFVYHTFIVSVPPWKAALLP
jgi:hypothetical protein